MKNTFKKPSLKVELMTDDIIVTSLNTVDNSYHDNYQSLAPERNTIWNK